MPGLTNDQRKMYRHFAAEFPQCWACLIRPLDDVFYREPTWSYHTTSLETHHLVHGQGRAHDRRAILRLCRIHHGAIHGQQYRPLKQVEPPAALTLGEQCWLKEYFDPEYFSIEYIQSLRIKHAEEIELTKP